jgi:hypothetical protein
VGRPILPSLPEEEQLGWDVGYVTVVFAMFLQFKRGEYVSRQHPDSPTWHHVGMPHYRFAIDTAGHQFLALHHLAVVTQHLPVQVAYTAPRFHESQVFTGLHLARDVLDNSFGCNPLWVAVDGDVHHRVVSEDDTQHLICSDPVRTPNVMARPYLEDALITHRGRDRADLTLEALANQLRSACMQAQMSDGRDQPRDVSPLDRLAYWANLIGVTPVIWIPRSS